MSSLDQVARSRPLRVIWKSYELRPGGGLPDPAKLAMIRSYHPRLLALAASVGAPMSDALPVMGLDTRPVHEASKLVAARHPEREHAFHLAVYRAHFVDGRNMGERATLLALGEEAGVPASELESALAGGDFREAVLADQREAHARRVTGVPSMWIGERPLVAGFLPPAELRAALDHVAPRG